MATVPTQIRIDQHVKKEAAKLFNELGLDMSSAVNLFLHKCVLRGGIPFMVEVPKYNKATLEAIEEDKKIAIDPSVESYENIDDLRKALLKDWNIKLNSPVHIKSFKLMSKRGLDLSIVDQVVFLLSNGEKLE